MRRAPSVLAVLALLIATIALAPSRGTAGDTPLWVKHVQNFPGGISNGVRARLAAGQVDVSSGARAARQPVGGTDILM